MYELESLSLHVRRKIRAGLTILLLVSCWLLAGACDPQGTGLPGHVADDHTASAANVSALLQARGLLQLKTFERWIALMQRYGPVDVYRQELVSDRRALAAARTQSAYQGALQQLGGQVAGIRIPALKAEASSLDQQLSRQVAAWSQSHTYRDTYNDTTYKLGYEYGSEGVGGMLRDELAGAKTSEDYRQAVEDASMYLQNFQAYQANAGDTTPWNQAHRADLQLLHHYILSGQNVVVISLGEQALRVYDHGRLIKAFQVTTGRPEKPSLPGAWSVESKQAPTVFKSDEPPGSAYWYPDTPIAYAMLYHSGGYFLHDSWWRDNYGFGTQFPHVDSGGDSFSFDGSHGCVNLSTSNAAWLYTFVRVSTRVVIY
ncbi:MAG TPA: L,D-transpeptidase [Ktedonobacteraceae bacterium]|jgi:hypothetical protein